MRNQNSRSKLQPYPPSPLVRIHLNCQIQEKRKKTHKKDFPVRIHLSKPRNFCQLVLRFSGLKIYLSGIPFFVQIFMVDIFFFFFLFPKFWAKIVEHHNHIHENFGPVCVRQMIYFCRISTPEQIYLTGHFQYVWLLKRFTVSLNLRLNQ